MPHPKLAAALLAVLALAVAVAVSGCGGTAGGSSPSGKHRLATSATSAFHATRPLPSPLNEHDGRSARENREIEKAGEHVQLSAKAKQAINEKIAKEAATERAVEHQRASVPWGQQELEELRRIVCTTAPESVCTCVVDKIVAEESPAEFENLSHEGATIEGEDDYRECSK